MLFADDTTLLNTHCNKNFLKYSIIHDLEILMSWFNMNQLSLNSQKTVIINFWEDKTSSGISIDGKEIPLVKSIKFLGVHLDHRISWSTHIDQLHKKFMANKILLVNSRSMLTMDCLRSVYYAHVYSHLTYGLIIWGPMAKKDQSMN